MLIGGVGGGVVGDGLQGGESIKVFLQNGGANTSCLIFHGTAR